MSVDTAAELARADALMELRRYPEAAEAARRALAIDPQNALAARLIASAEFGAGHHREALKAAAAAIALEPDEEQAHRIASLACLALEDNERAKHEAREAVRLAPNSPGAHMALARALVAGHYSISARQHAERAVELAPHSAEAQYVLGSVANWDGRRRDARKALARALAIKPDYVPARNELARMNLKRGIVSGRAMADASMGFADALQSDPRSEVVRRNLELSVSVFLGQTAYLLFIAAYVGFVVDSDRHAFVQLLPLLLLLLPLSYAARYLRRLSTHMRRFLVDAVRRSRLVVPVGLEVLAAALIVGEVLTKQGTRSALACGAVIVALVARLLIWEQRRQNKRRPVV
jgi:tetratricopeptide (TPR) repeat protein